MAKKIKLETKAISPTESTTDYDAYKKVALFVRAAVRCGCRYLAVGGPSSRLEEQVVNAGKTLGLNPEVFTTPTGVFVSCLTPDKERVVTFVGRVKDISYNLTELEVMENILQKLGRGEISPVQALYFVKKHDLTQGPKMFVLKSIGALLIGFLATVLNFGSWTAGAIAGIITLLVHFIAGPVTMKLKLNPVFSHFIACFFGLSSAALASSMMQVPFEALAIGGLLILAPGLTLTTAISEIADQNYVSGIVKLMKSAINVSGMLVSYLLVLDIIGMTGWDVVSRLPEGNAMQGWPVYLPYLLYSSLVVGFCLNLSVPFKAYLGAMMTAFVSWTVLRQFTDPTYYVTATFMATVSVGLVSMIFSKLFKLPSQIFSVPGILILVPGMLAMSSFHSLAGLNDESIEIGLKVILIASSIVFGLFTARVPFMLSSPNEVGDDATSVDKELESLTEEDALTIELSDSETTVRSSSDYSIGLF